MTCLAFARLVRVAALLLYVSGTGSAMARQPAGHLLTQSDIFSLQHASDAQISPDGRFLAYVRSVPDIQTDGSDHTIWLVDLRTREQRAFGTPSSAPRWSPDGTRLAYLGRNANGDTGLYVATPSDPSVPPRSIAMDGDGPRDFVWSHDGTKLAFVRAVPVSVTDLAVQLPSRPPGAHWSKPPIVITTARYSRDGKGFPPPTRSALFVVGIGQGPATEVGSVEVDIQGKPCWGTDDKTLIFAGTPRADMVKYQTPALYEVGVSNGPLTRLTSGTDAYDGPALSPDGRYLAYLRYDTSHMIWVTQLWLLDRATGQVTRQLTGLDRDIAQVDWTSRGRLVFSYEDEGEGTFGTAIVGGAPSIIARHGSGEAFSVANDGTIGYIQGAPDHPGEPAVSDGGGGGGKVVAPLNTALLDDRRLGQVVPFDAVSSYDASRVPGWAILPPGYRRGATYPTILWLHGGPHGSEGPQWRFDWQLMAAAGYVVLYPNPRGSTSYGSRWTFGLAYDAPQHDYDDVMSIVDAAVGRGLADPKRLYVTGVSYGAEMTTWIVGHTSRFRAAVAEKPSVDFGAADLENDQYAGVTTDARGLPWQHPGAWWASSPLAFVGNVSTPTMLIAGEDDKRTPPGQSQQFYNALKIRGVPTALVLYPDASHETLGAPRSQMLSKTDFALAWFARYK